MQLSIIVGNPKPRSRTLAVAEAVAERIADATGAQIARAVDLCDHANGMFQWPNDQLTELAAAVSASHYLVVASPTYKASYTGLLKSLIDRYPSNGLEGRVASPVMTGGSPAHAMAVDVYLRPLLTELGASVPTRGLFFLADQIDVVGRVVNDWAAVNLSALTSLATV